METLAPYGALLSTARCRCILPYTWYFQIVELSNKYKFAKLFHITVLKVDRMVGHHIGINQMYPDRSSSLKLYANGSMGWQIIGDLIEIKP